MLAGRNAEHGEKVAAELQNTGADAVFVRTDISDVSQAQAAVAATIERHGRIDCLVNAAGLTTRGTMLDTTPELFDQHIAVNLRAPFFLMQAAIADMRQRGEPGTIVNVISIDSHGGQAFLAPYVAAKAGLAGLTKNAAHAHRWDRIRINGLNMGWSATDGENRPPSNRPHGAGADWQTAGRRPGCRWASSARSTRSPTSSSSCSPTAAASSPGRSSTGTRTSSAASDDERTSRHRCRTTSYRGERTMRLGLIGLGRIGAFHADTLSQLPAVDSLVVTDAVPAVTKAVAENGSARRRPTPRRASSAAVSTPSSSPRPPTPTPS